MTQNESNTSYALLAVALAASLLYRPVIAADPDPSSAPADARSGKAAVSEPLQQDFDELISEIEARQPAQSPAVGTKALGTGTTEEQLNAARIHIGTLQQAVLAALAARAEAEAQLETLWRDSRAEIEALKAAKSDGGTSDVLTQAKGEPARGTNAPAADAVQAAFQPGDRAAAGSAAESATGSAATGPAEIMVNEIHFNPGSAKLTPGGERKTLAAADRIKALGARNVRVAGYTDTQGPAAYNMHLSLQRAKSIADLLASVGVAAEIIEVEGHGEEGIPEPTPDQVAEPLNRCAGIFAMVDLPADPAQP